MVPWKRDTIRFRVTWQVFSIPVLALLLGGEWCQLEVFRTDQHVIVFVGSSGILQEQEGSQVVILGSCDSVDNLVVVEEKLSGHGREIVLGIFFTIGNVLIT